jgi:hypothetical protein
MKLGGNHLFFQGPTTKSLISPGRPRSGARHVAKLVSAYRTLEADASTLRARREELKIRYYPFRW